MERTLNTAFRGLRGAGLGERFERATPRPRFSEGEAGAGGAASELQELQELQGLRPNWPSCGCPGHAGRDPKQALRSTRRRWMPETLMASMASCAYNGHGMSQGPNGHGQAQGLVRGRVRPNLDPEVSKGRDTP